MAGDRFTALDGSEADVADWLEAAVTRPPPAPPGAGRGRYHHPGRGAIEPHEPVHHPAGQRREGLGCCRFGGPRAERCAAESSGRGVGGTELFGAVVADQVLRVGEAPIPLPRLVVIGDVEGRGILVGMDVLRGTIVTVSADPALPVFWQVP